MVQVGYARSQEPTGFIFALKMLRNAATFSAAAPSPIEKASGRFDQPGGR
jgi:hypothetical protein